MYPNETCKYSVASSYEEAKKVRLDNVKEEYEKLMMAKKVFYVIGDIDLNTVKTAFDKISFNTYQKEELNFLDLETKQIEKVNEIIEKQANKQSIVLMGYRSEIRENDELYNGMFYLIICWGDFFIRPFFKKLERNIV